jgi:adenylylsulfate kinase-like enzyme
MRESISGEGFGAEDRHTHNLRVARLAHVLSKQSPVVVAVIAPFSETRREINRMISPRWVLCRRGAQKEGSEFPYEVPNPTEIDLVADNDTGTPAENAAAVVEMLRDSGRKTAAGFVDAEGVAQAASAVDEAAG